MPSFGIRRTTGTDLNEYITASSVTCLNEADTNKCENLFMGDGTNVLKSDADGEWSLLKHVFCSSLYRWLLFLRNRAAVDLHPFPTSCKD
jgi:hypothetical protein